MAISTPKYSPDYSTTPNCPITYSCDSNCSTGNVATSTLAGSQPKMTIIAKNVGTTIKSFTARMTSSSTAKPATSSIKITVFDPCEITEATIATITTQVGISIESAAHPVFTYTNQESTVALCGAIVYELVGTSSYLSYDTSSRKIKITLTPS